MGEYISPEFQEKIEKAFEGAFKGAISNVSFANTYGNTTTGTWVSGSIDGVTGWHYIFGEILTEKDFIPVKIIYSCPATICYFFDGTKTIVKCAEDEVYIKEEGVMACIMKKLFSSRNKFKKLVASGYENENAEIERELHNDIATTRIDEEALVEFIKHNSESEIETEIESIPEPKSVHVITDEEAKADLEGKPRPKPEPESGDDEYKTYGSVYGSPE